MSNIRIVTDSSAHLTPQEQQTHGVTVVPLRIRMGQKTYKHGVDLNDTTYFRRLNEIKTLPRLQSPLLQDFIDAYSQLSQETDQILSIHISSKLSDTLAVARMASSMLRGHTRITIIDSETLSRGLGMIALNAAELANEGAPVREVSRLVRSLIPSIFLNFALSDLSHLKRDNRIRKGQTILGTMFKIKPMVEIREGNLVVMEKVRSQLDVEEKLYHYISEFAYLKEIALLQHGATSTATHLLERLELAFPDLPIFTDSYDAPLATFIGPAAVGVVVREDYEL